MRKLKIFLADLVHSRRIYNYAVPLNIGYIAESIKVKFYKETDLSLFKFPDDLLKALKDKPDIVAFSNYDWNVNLNKAVISVVHDVSPHTLIIMGGPNIRKGRKGIMEFLQERCDVDIYVVNEGEDGMCSLVEFILGSFPNEVKNLFFKENPSLPNIAYLSDKRKEMVFLEQRNNNGNIITYPSPWLSGTLTPYFNNSSFPLFPLIETNRGCPHQCAFCTWGSFEDNKVRKFPLDVVFEELCYIFEKAENDFHLIIADANFGIFGRDVEIAREIKRLAGKYSKITSVEIFSSKNTVKRNLEIYSILGDLAMPTFAVQSFNKDVLRNAGRSNIRLDSIQQFVGTVNKKGLKVYTDLLIGLPGETKESHVNNIKTANHYGFDHAQIGEVRLLKGSRIEEDDYVKKYGIETRWRVIPSAMGEYGGKRVVEYENCIMKTYSMSYEDILDLRLFHGYLFLLHRVGIGQPILDFSDNNGLNFVDLIMRIAKRPPEADYPLLFKQIDHYLENANSEWFETEEQANAYYLRDNIFKKLVKDGFTKLNYDFAAKVITHVPLRRELLCWVACNVQENIIDLDVSVLGDLVEFCNARIYSFPLKDSSSSLNVSSKSFLELGKFVKDASLYKIPKDSNVKIMFIYDRQKARVLSDKIKNYNVSNDMLLAIQVLLQTAYKEIYMDAMATQQTQFQNL
jgi:radical SAM superfamily enzyme YgiQ (UPF0313 family)